MVISRRYIWVLTCFVCLLPGWAEGLHAPHSASQRKVRSPLMVMEGSIRNPYAEDAIVTRGRARDEAVIGEAATVDELQQAEQTIERARKELFRSRVARQAKARMGPPVDLIDAKTGAPLAAEDAIDEMAQDDTLITKDEFGPIGPGRKERIAQMAGLTPEQAKALWPWDDPTPVNVSDLVRTRKFFGEGSPEEMQGALQRLAPTKGKERQEQLKRTVLTSAEASFACWAALGFPFPIRVGKLGGQDTPPPPNGYVIFNPELYRADLTKTQFRPRHITYRWMEGKSEVYSAEAEVETYLHLPRPSMPVTHLLVSSDDDVMAYQLVGLFPPQGIWDVRKVITGDLVDLYSYQRVPVILYGLRWSLMPGIEEIQDQPQTRARLAEIMEALGFLKPGQALKVIRTQLVLPQNES